MKQFYLLPGEWAFSSEPTIISTILGSCVAVALYDYKLKFGALNHYLLPEVMPDEKPSARYGAVAMPAIIDAMLDHGSNKKSLQAKVYGGGNVLSGVEIGVGIGVLNVEFAIRYLEKSKIPILEKNVGGKQSRKIMLNTSTFDVMHVFQDKNDE